MMKIDTILCLGLMSMATLSIIAADISLAKSQELELQVRNYMVMTMSHDQGIVPPNTEIKK